ncbi:MAG: hypothetical protein AB7W37_00325 [Syntrophobacteraceae bacterium]
MAECGKCGAKIEPDETYEHAGRTMCEDCYLDVVSKPKTCDPWAVHTAKSCMNTQAGLTPAQEEILTLLRKGPVTKSEACKQLKMDQDELERNFAALRHMELARGCKVDGQVCLTLFNDAAH